ncbi:sugar transferase [Thermoflexus sp.]|uniref:sugar transferase n=1 Tax=Thermoflexus sp. TaxID=1969742 RepID=UPI002ADD432F|nr:sugar transferase [Thermoflexus sp.]
METSLYQETRTSEHSVRRSLFPLPFSERRLVLSALDLLAVNGALILALDLRPGYILDGTLMLRYPLWFLVLSLLWLLVAQAFDAYDLRVAGRFSSSALAVLKAGLVTSGVYLLIPYVTPALPASRSALLAFPLIAVGSLVAARGLYRVALSQPAWQHRALIIGAGWAGRTIAEALAEHSDGSYRIVGFVDDDPAKQGHVLHVSNLALPVLGTRHVLPDLIRQHHIDTLILAITHEMHGELLQVLMDCLELGVEIVPMPVLYEQLTGRVPIEHVGSNWYVAMPIHHPLTRPFNRIVKRILDIVGATLGLVFLALVFPFIALAIYIDSPGPIFYVQKRVGQGGRIFRAYKFRTMIPDAEKGQAVWAQKNDPRVTRVGRILRKTHIDEFPQFINILKGEMSAVGPRPERPEFVEELAREIPFYRVRHAVKPGMAGWALVKYGYAASKTDAMIRLQYDLYYIKHWSLWFDLVILLKTILNTIALRGRA